LRAALLARVHRGRALACRDPGPGGPRAPRRHPRAPGTVSRPIEARLRAGD